MTLLLEGMLSITVPLPDASRYDVAVRSLGITRPDHKVPYEALPKHCRVPPFVAYAATCATLSHLALPRRYSPEHN